MSRQSPPDRGVVRPGAARTDVSVIVPTHGRPAALAACLRALAASDYEPGAWEVIVVNDGGHAGTDRVVEEFRGDLRVRLVAQPQRGPAAARNHGATLARGLILAFTDDDCLPAPDWVSAVVRALGEAPDAMIGGRVENALPDNPFATASQQLVAYLYEYHERTERLAFFTSNNLALARRAFVEIGGFNGGFPLAAGEDREFSARWRRGGGRMLFVPGMIVRHAHALGARSFLRQHYNYGRGAYHYHRIRHLQEQSHRHLPEPLSFYTDLLRYPLGDGPRGVLHAALLLVSQFANAAGYFREALGGRAERAADRSGGLALAVEPMAGAAAEDRPIGGD